MGDEARLGDVSTRIKPTLDHLVHVARTAEAAGFEGMLVPTGEMCLDAWMVAATLGQCNQLLLEKALQKAGLTDKDIQLVNMNPDDAGSAFAAGKMRRTPIEQVCDFEQRCHRGEVETALRCAEM